MQLVIAGSVAFLMSLMLTPVVRDLFLRWGLVDWPDQVRKLHTGAIPRVGGVAVAIAYAIPLAMVSFGPLRPAGSTAPPPPFSWEFPVAAFIVFATGLLDDLHSLKPWQKLLGQCAGAGLACWAGVRMDGIVTLPFSPAVSVPVTFLWLILCTNAFNLIDGLDGLAAGVGVFATLTIMLAAILQHNTPLMLATLPLAASLLGFLRYNFCPASIFLGDSASMLVGFLLGCYGVLWSQKSATMLGMMAPVTALALPLLDAGLAIARRFLRGQPIFSGDRRHIHHMLLDRGLTPRRAVFLLYGFCALAAGLSLLQSTREFAGVAIIIFCVGFWIAVQRLGYVEFGVLGWMLRETTSLRTMHARIHLSEFRSLIAACRTQADCWQVILRYYKKFGYSQVALNLGDEVYTSPRHKSAGAGGAWTMIIQLNDRDSARLSRDEDLPQTYAAAAFADALAAALKERMPVFRSAHTAGQERSALACSPSELVP